MALAVQPDGKIVVGGSFDAFGDQGIRYNIARLNPDGTREEGFNPGKGVNGVVYSVALQNDGKILLGGQFSSIYQQERDGIAKFAGGAATPVEVSLTALVPEIPVTGGAVRAFLLKLPKPTDHAVTVHYSIGGRAQGGKDYVALAGSKTIPAYQLQTGIRLRPQADLGGPANRTVHLTLLPDPAYNLGPATSAKVKIVSGQ